MCLGASEPRTVPDSTAARRRPGLAACGARVSRRHNPFGCRPAPQCGRGGPAGEFYLQPARRSHASKDDPRLEDEAAAPQPGTTRMACRPATIGPSGLMVAGCPAYLPNFRSQIQLQGADRDWLPGRWSAADSSGRVGVYSDGRNRQVTCSTVSLSQVI